MKPIRLMTLAPGHFHAALVQKRMHPVVHRRAFVYAPLDADLVAHLDRLAAFNARPDDPTGWEVDVRAGPNYLDRFLREQPGNTVVLSGRNRPKIDLMRLAVANNLHVLADKPWVVEAADLPKLEQLLHEAEAREVVVWDVMTERHEVTTRLQWVLVGDVEVFGEWQAGTPADPALVLESAHRLKKAVAGRPLRRPWWWFDPGISGEAMADVGTHLADLAMWLVLPDQPVDYRLDVAVLDADRWPLVLDEDQFRELTGLPDFPPELAPRVVAGQLYYAGNNTVTFALRGVHVRLTTLWEYESAGGGDTHRAVARGTKATVEVRQEPGGEPEVFVAAADPGDHPRLLEVLRRKWSDTPGAAPGSAVEDRGTEARLVIPRELRTGHEAHFAEVVEEFARYFHAPRSVPAWERANVLAKYFITTRAVELARQRRTGMV
jgi:predicted dehydrogenase